MKLTQISPEGFEIAHTYLETQDIETTAVRLGISPVDVSTYLEKAEVRNYISNVYLNAGYRNRFKLGSLMDSIIDKKLEELEEAGIGSSKDILEILTLAHKMRMDELKLAAELEKASAAKVQTNIQINNNNPYAGTQYGALLDTLLGNASDQPQ